MKDVKPLSAADAKLCCEDQERVSLQRLLRQHCQAIASGAHVVIDTATHVAVEKLTEAEARGRWEKWRGQPVAFSTRPQLESWLAALRSLNLIRED